MITHFVRSKELPTALPSLKLRLEHAVSHVLLILPNKKTTLASGFYGRGDMIRTCDTLVPNQVLYQAELRPVDKVVIYIRQKKYKCKQKI